MRTDFFVFASVGDETDAEARRMWWNCCLLRVVGWAVEKEVDDQALTTERKRSKRVKGRTGDGRISSCWVGDGERGTRRVEKEVSFVRLKKEGGDVWRLFGLRF